MLLNNYVILSNKIDQSGGEDAAVQSKKQLMAHLWSLWKFYIP